MSTPTRQRCRASNGIGVGAIAVLCTLLSVGPLSLCSGYLSTRIMEAPSGFAARSTLVTRLPNTAWSGKERGNTGAGRRRVLPPPPSSSTGLFSSPSGSAAAAAVSVEDDDENDLETAMSFRSEATTLFLALITGAASGVAVSWFKLAIDWVRHLTYGGGRQQQVLRDVPRFLIPAMGGVLVSMLRLMGRFPPGLAGSVSELNAEAASGRSTSTSTSTAARDDPRNPLRYLRKTLAAVATLGTGCSLGPEGPAVEVGMGISRVLGGVCEGLSRTLRLTLLERKLLLACGAAAGVSAGFNAPVAAVFFALEVVQAALLSQPVDDDASEGAEDVGSDGNGDANKLRQYLFCKTSISSILLASVVSALVSKSILKDHLIFTLSAYSLASPLMELPLYLVLGFLSGLAAFVFGRGASFIRGAFDGSGPGWTKSTIGSIPPFLRPMTGGLVCGLVGITFPQILFFGYETLNGLMANNPLPTASVVALLGVKMFTTAVAAGSGLVGGTFAPSLFMGSMLGAAFHNVAVGCVRTTNESMRTATTAVATAGVGGWLWAPPSLALADIPAYALVGAGSMLASLFRAPLTASMLLFEIARDYDVILPLMASAGVGSLTVNIVESKVEAWKRQRCDDSGAD